MQPLQSARDQRNHKEPFGSVLHNLLVLLATARNLQPVKEEYVCQEITDDSHLPSTSSYQMVVEDTSFTQSIYQWVAIQFLGFIPAHCKITPKKD